MYTLSTQEQDFILTLRLCINELDLIETILINYFGRGRHDKAYEIANTILNQWVINGQPMTEVYFED